VCQPELVANAERDDGGRVTVRAPAVGLWRGAPTTGAFVRAGGAIGELEILGVLHSLCVPNHAHGTVVESSASDGLARTPVSHGDRLLVLETGHVASIAAEPSESDGPGAHGLLLRAPTSGRFYRRPAPDKPPFLRVGDIVADGETVGLVEVMKTFHRVAYGGEGLPPRARVRAIFPADQDDLEAGDPLLELEAVD
jgi:acetyl-CoA carboxylase biotin carboxyl carrier protein